MANGTIAIAPGILQKSQNQSAATHKAAARRTPQPRLRILIRRLPPGLTEHEFVSLLGPEWKIGAGKVDWFVYRPGKISRNPAKPSRPARVYVRVTETSLVQALSEKVRQTTFQDAKNTTKDLALLGPPTVEFATYTKTPASRKRKDARQGTIDQDPEFMAFLDSLTDPIQKPVVDLEPAPKAERWLTTPLIEHIREKKAKKEKPSAGKASKKDSKDAAAAKAKNKEASASSTTPAVGDKTKKQTKASRPKEAVKVLNRSGNSNTAAASTSTATSNPTDSTASATSSQEATKKAPAERRRERTPAPFNLAAKIQRDLGLNPSPRKTSGTSKEAKPQTAAAAADPNASDANSSKSGAQSSVSIKRDGQGRNRRNSKPPKPDDDSTANAGAGKTTGQPAAAAVTTKAQGSPTVAKSNSPAAARVPASGTRAFLKHANASQGITEALLKTALSSFGAVTKVEIDQKKGTAFADFETPQGLTAAIAKNKIEVGKGAVTISEYRERPARAPRSAAASAATAGNQAASSGSTGAASPAANPASASSSAEAGRGRGGRGRGGRGRAVSKAAAGGKVAGSAATSTGGAANASNG